MTMQWRRRWRCLVAVLAAAASRTGYSSHGDASSVVDALDILDISAFSSPPLVEILFPPNDYLLMKTAVEIEIAMRIELLRQHIDEQRVCISVTMVQAPEGVVLDGGSGLSERCYERYGNYTTFHASGLLPGLHYGVSAGLMNGGIMLGYSTRTFQVASVVAQVDGTIVHMSIAEAMDTAEQLHRRHELSQASEVYHKVLEMFPNYARALHRLGQAAFQEGRIHDALELTKRAVSLHATDETMHVTLARCYTEIDRTDLAIQHYRRALELRPSYATAALNLGIIWQAIGKYDDAMHEFRKVVSTPNDPSNTQHIMEMQHYEIVREALAWLCELIRLSESWHEADRCLTQAKQRFQFEPRFVLDRGHLLSSSGQFELAQKEFDAAINLGAVYGVLYGADMTEALGAYDESLQQYNDIIEKISMKAPMMLDQVLIMMSLVMPRILPGSQEAIDVIRGRVELEVSLTLNSVERMRSPIPFNPTRILYSTGVSLNSHNRNNRFLKSLIGKMYHKLLIEPGVFQDDFTDNYGISPVSYRQELNTPFSGNSNRLRVGFVSRFLYSPAVGLFIDELLPQLNVAKYEVFAFAIGASKSIKGYEQVDQIAEHVVALPRDLRLARAEIRASNLDLLIFPELGMDKITYFLSFYRLARVQAAWWGNPDTTGVPNIDYYLTSEHEHHSFRDHYSEPVYQMKGMGIFHELPPLPNSTITRDDIRRAIYEKFPVPQDFHFYLCIDAMLHIHPDFDEALRQILVQDPLAHVFLLSSSNRKNWKQLFVTRLNDRLGSENVAKITFLTDVDARQEIHLLSAADCVLGSLHSSRPKAALQAFTAGVPVVTLAGELWASRITAGFYNQMELRDLVTSTIEEYVGVAIRLASDHKFRSRMTRKIRRRRERLSKDRTAVAEWEKFFDHVASQHKPEDTIPSELSDQQQEEDDASPIDTTTTASAASMTCPAMSMQNLW